MTPEEVSLIEEVITEDDIIRFKTEAPKQRRYPHCTVSITKMTSTEKKRILEPELNQQRNLRN
jgi:hypothetical protein